MVYELVTGAPLWRKNRSDDLLTKRDLQILSIWSDGTRDVKLATLEEKDEALDLEGQRTGRWEAPVDRHRVGTGSEAVF